MNKPNASYGKRFRLPAVLLISIGHHIHDIYTSFLAPILPLLITKLGMNYTLAGFLSVIQRIPALFNPFVGIIAENLRIRYLVILTPATTAIFMSLIGVAPNYIFLAVILFFAGLSSTFFHVPTPVMIKQVSGNQLGKGMSFYMLGGEFARTVGPVVILGAVSLWGLEGTYRLIPFGVVTSLVLFWKLKNVDVRSVQPKDSSQVGYWQTFKKFLPVFLGIASMSIFWGGMKAALTLYLPTYLNLRGSGLWFSGISLSALQLAGAIGALLAGSFSDRRGRMNTLLMVAFALPLLMLLFVHVTGIAVIPVLLVTGFFLFAPTPIFLAIIHELKTTHMPFVNGIFMTINFFISSVMMMLVGYLSDTLGMVLTFKITALMAILAIPFALRLKIKGDVG